MAPPKTEVKKQQSRRSRKARTEVSSSSESEASSDSDSSISDNESEKPSKPAVKAASKARESLSPSPEEESSTLPASKSKAESEQAFESFYLRQAAQEFSDDLDKLRGASDFKGQSSVELLVSALKQGGACFSADERSRVAGGGLNAK
ncbi:hypothetical protein Q7P37_007256 [Cladosporium fusiforme]